MDRLTEAYMGIFDLDELGTRDRDIPYEYIGFRALDTDGEPLKGRTIKSCTRVMIPHPYLCDRLMTMVVRRRSKDGVAAAHGYALVALLAHDDENGWRVTGLVDESRYEETMEALEMLP